MFLVETGSIVADQTFLSLFPASIETEAEYTFVKVGIVKPSELFTKCTHVVGMFAKNLVKEHDLTRMTSPPALLRSGVGRQRAKACGTRWLPQPGVKFCKCIQAAVGGVLRQNKKERNKKKTL